MRYIWLSHMPLFTHSKVNKMSFFMAFKVNHFLGSIRLTDSYSRSLDVAHGCMNVSG